MHAVQVGDVNPSLIWWWAVGAVLLNMHAEETHVGSVDVLEREQGFHPVRERVCHLCVVHEPESKTAMNTLGI